MNAPKPFLHHNHKEEVENWKRNSSFVYQSLHVTYVDGPERCNFLFNHIHSLYYQLHPTTTRRKGIFLIGQRDATDNYLVSHDNKGTSLQSKRK